MNIPEQCFFSDLKTTDKKAENDYIEYYISVEKLQYRIRLNHSFNPKESKFLQKNKFILKGLIFNQKLPKEIPFITSDIDLKELLSDTRYPKSEQEKLDNLFLHIIDKQKHYGEVIEFKDVLGYSFPEMLYFKNIQELVFFIETLNEKGLIKISDRNDKSIFKIQVAFKGLRYSVQLKEEGSRSNNCFIAMSFGEGVSEIRKKIKEACIECGYKPILIDEVPIPFEDTINDAIIANIKKSKFCIADFTHQKKGVYFEAGYALGRGLPVIYTCKQDCFKDTHFDTNHFPHIIYEDIEEMKLQLKNRIKAWIE